MKETIRIKLELGPYPSDHMHTCSINQSTFGEAWSFGIFYAIYQTTFGEAWRFGIFYAINQSTFGVAGLRANPPFL